MNKDTNMTDVAIVSTARTGLAKSWKGAFNMTYGATLAITVSANCDMLALSLA